ncbi:MAG: fructosamine kinase family protein [Bacteroidetes bacterium]|nr:fructosamine kinase family protein [Bacteroidota bacterium]
MIPQEIKDSLAGFFSRSQHVPVYILEVSSLSGGCINHVQRVKTSIGDFCIKYNMSDRFPGMFTCEADGLDLLKSSGEIRVPEVCCTGEAGSFAYILLEFIDPGKRQPFFMRDFGKSLARMHRHTAGYFGHTTDNYMGSLPQSNNKHDDWNSFFIEERLMKQVSLAENYFSSPDLAAFDRLYDRLGDILPAEPPAMLHGDLWGGNYMVATDGKACLIDPAVYYGHREADIAMTTLFGGFDETFYAAYREEYPLEKGWEKRLDIFKLYPLLIHLNLFGSGYLGSIVSIIRKY